MSEMAQRAPDHAAGSEQQPRSKSTVGLIESINWREESIYAATKMGLTGHSQRNFSDGLDATRERHQSKEEMP